MHGGSRSTIKSIGAPDQEGANPRRGSAPGESGRWDNRDARAIARPTLAIITTTAVARRNEIRDNSSDPPTDLSVHITTGSSGASMRYTTDGSIPHTGSLPNGALINGTSGYVTIQANTVKTLKAIAFGAGYQDSTVTSAVFDRVDHTTTCVPPTFNPYGQSQGQHPPVAVPVTISTTTTGASISYTLSSSSNDIPTPTHGTIVNATSTTAWIGINNFWYLKAIAFKSGSYNSSVTSSTYDNTDPGGGNSPVQGDDKLSGHGSRGQRQLNQMDSVRSVTYTLDNCGTRTQFLDAGIT
jgi:hypothetical protein